MRTDTERLDFLEERQSGVYQVFNSIKIPNTTGVGPTYTEGREFVGWFVHGSKEGEYSTIREAVDHAMDD